MIIIARRHLGPRDKARNLESFSVARHGRRQPLCAHAIPRLSALQYRMRACVELSCFISLMRLRESDGCVRQDASTEVTKCAVIRLRPIKAHPDASLPQNRQSSFTYVLGGKAVFTHYDITRSRRAEPVYTQHVAAVADVAMPALRCTRLNGKPRVDRRQ